MSTALETSYYKDKYGTPRSEKEAVDILADTYKKLFKHITMAEKEGIGEYYRIVKSRELPAFEWMMDAFHMVAKKEEEKRNFSYIVGMLRQWMKFGYGHIPTQEEEDIIDYLEEETGVHMSLPARRILKRLMGTYGAIKVTRMIPRMRECNDLAEYYALCLETVLTEKFPTPEVNDNDNV